MLCTDRAIICAGKTHAWELAPRALPGCLIVCKNVVGFSNETLATRATGGLSFFSPLVLDRSLKL